MEWPSKNVSQGGILHTAKTQYNPETKQVLKLLLDESKLSIMQRRKFEYFLRNGEPFPVPKSKSENSLSKLREPLLIRPGSSKRKTREDIIKSGLYEREKFIPKITVDREQEKLKLQDKMAFGKAITPLVSKPKPEKEKPEKEKELNRFDELTREIKERKDWLNEMEELGEGEKYKAVIQQQIQARVREMEKLKIGDSSIKTKKK